MKTFMEKFGGAVTTIIVTTFIALVALIIKHESEILLIKYRLDQQEKDFDEHDNHKVNK